MELLKAKQEEEKRRLEEQLRSRMEAQRQQMENMMRANMEELQRERKNVVAQNRTLQEKVEGNAEVAKRRKCSDSKSPAANERNCTRCVLALPYREEALHCRVEEIKQRPLSDLLKLYQIQSKID